MLLSLLPCMSATVFSAVMPAGSVCYQETETVNALTGQFWHHNDKNRKNALCQKMLSKFEGKPRIEQAMQDKLDKAIFFHKAIQTT